MSTSEAEHVALWMIRNSYATAHGDTVENMLLDLEEQAQERGRREMRDIIAALYHAWCTDTSPPAGFLKFCREKFE